MSKTVTITFATEALADHFNKLGNDELVKFMERGEYDVNFRRNYNKKRSDDLKLVAQLRKEGKLPTGV